MMRRGESVALWVRWVVYPAVFSLAPLILLSAGSAEAAGLWRSVPSDVARTEPRGEGRRWVEPLRFAAADLDGAALASLLDGVPDEFTGAAGLPLEVPRPDGGVERFEVWRSPVMEPELAAWLAAQGWPMMTYAGRSLERPGATIRLDSGGPAGFHASVLGPDGESYYVDPLWRGDRRRYASYFVGDAGSRAPFSCGVHGRRSEPLEAPLVDRALDGAARAGTLRVFRHANAATGEYTQFHGGTVSDGQAAVVTAINRVNQVYERDLSVRLVLVGNNSSIIYTNPNTDPYTNSNPSALLSENQSNLDSVIGSANYDVGHVFSTGGGGLAGLGVICSDGSKAQGETGSSSPTGDPFWIDYVAHEVGHQFGGNHTFDGVNGSCSGGNRNDSTAYEPGSGSTIMAYAGICGPDDLQSNSDDLFHAASLAEMLATVSSNSCYSTQTNTNSNAPTVSAGTDYTIPANTPFVLTAASWNDADGDTLTFAWEEYDLSAGFSGDDLASGDQGDNPIIRAWNVSSSPSRTIPRMSNLLAGTSAPGEILPQTTRTMTFRVTVRDSHTDGGLTGTDTMQLDVTTAAGPFRLTSPNGGESLQGVATITWDVAGTTASPVFAANVDITLSCDGGATFSYTLASNTPNDGSETVSLPSVDSTTCRAKVQATDNIFFDISDGDFTVSAGTPGPTATPTPTITPGGPTLTPTATPTPTANCPVLDEGFDDISALAGWYRQNNPDIPGTTEWFQGNSTIFAAHQGSATAYIAADFDNTGGSQISNWLLTPEISFAGGLTLSFYTRTVLDSPFPDNLEVRVSTNGSSTNVGTGPNDVGDFTNLELEINPSLGSGVYPETWTEYRIDLSAYAGTSGRVAFRYDVPLGAGPDGSNSSYIGIDTVTTFCSPGPPSGVPASSRTGLVLLLAGLAIAMVLLRRRLPPAS